jgi:hypothetical protein
MQQVNHLIFIGGQNLMSDGFRRQNFCCRKEVKICYFVTGVIRSGVRYFTWATVLFRLADPGLGYYQDVPGETTPDFFLPLNKISEAVQITVQQFFCK